MNYLGEPFRNLWLLHRLTRKHLRKDVCVGPVGSILGGKSSRPIFFNTQQLRKNALVKMPKW